ncbi:MAG TPA: ABC transporter ATP-binding protein [Blastocatellia bacterium]
MRPIIKVENLSKQYRIGARQESFPTLRDSIANAFRAPLAKFRRNGESANTIWALKDINFEVAPGEVVGVIGRNGAGKSTLLKILSRITEPTSGRADIYGRVGSLLEVGTGFHHELSGRENIYLNGAILGMKRNEIGRRFDEIVSFAEIENFIDTPVKHYSSGMYMRLAFAVAAHLEPEVLLVDEVLAVGDVGFQKKCLGKMRDVGRQGRTVLLVSHNMGAVLNLCERVILITNGQVQYEGQTYEGVNSYHQLGYAMCEGEVDLSFHPARRPEALPLLKTIRLLDGSGAPKGRFMAGEKMMIEFTFDPVIHLANPQFGVGVEDSQGSRIFAVATYLANSQLPPLRGPCKVTCHIEELILAPGRYILSLSAGEPDNTLLDALECAVAFEVDHGNYFGNGSNVTAGLGKILVRSRWEKTDL